MSVSHPLRIRLGEPFPYTREWYLNWRRSRDLTTLGGAVYPVGDEDIIDLFLRGAKQDSGNFLGALAEDEVIERAEGSSWMNPDGIWRTYDGRIEYIEHKPTPPSPPPHVHDWIVTGIEPHVPHLMLRDSVRVEWTCGNSGCPRSRRTTSTSLVKPL